MKQNKNPLIIPLVFIFIFSAVQTVFGADVYGTLPPEKKLVSYKTRLHLPFTDRVTETPAVLLEYLGKLDSTDRYKSYSPSKDEMETVIKYSSSLPEQFKSILDKRVIGIYFIENFQGGGLTDIVYDEKENMFLILAFNPRTLRESLTDWITYRDNSPFQNDGSGITIESDLSGSYRGFLHTLIHEASHGYDYIVHATPYPEPALADKMWGNLIMDRRFTAFTKFIWEDYSKPLKNFEFKSRTDVHAYGFGPAMGYGKAPGIYEALDKTYFSSLYGSSNWAEDFAEIFTMNYLDRKFSIRYKVKIFKDKKLIFTYSPLEKKEVRERYNRIELRH